MGDEVFPHAREGLDWADAAFPGDQAWRLEPWDQPLLKQGCRGDGRIYIVGCEVGDESRYKIGHTTKSPQTRLSQLQVGNPFEMEMMGWFYGSSHVESLLHREFRAHHIRGEWFGEDPRLSTLIHTLPDL